MAIVADNITFEVITDVEGFKSLKEIWNQFLTTSIHSICMKWEWIDTWLETFPESAHELHILVIRDGNTVIGIAPFYTQYQVKYRVFKYKTLMILGIGEPVENEVVSEFQDILVLTGYEDQVSKLIVLYLSFLVDWDTILVRDCLEDSIIYHIILALKTQEGYWVEDRRNYVRFIIDLPDSFEKYLASLKAHTRTEIRRKLRKFETLENVSCKIVSSTEELDTVLVKLVELHNNRWNKMGKPGAFAGEKFRQFIYKICLSSLEEGSLDLRYWTHNDKIISTDLDFRCDDTTYSYQIGYDTDEAYTKYSLGVILFLTAIRTAIEKGYAKYDFMKDVPYSWKKEYARDPKNMFDFTVFSKGVKGRLLSFEYRNRPKLKKLLKREVN